MAQNRYKLILSGNAIPEPLALSEVIPLRYAIHRKGFWFQSLEQAEMYKQLMGAAFPQVNCEIVPPELRPEPEPMEVDKAVVDVDDGEQVEVSEGE